MTNVIGRPLPRVDGRAKVTGSARYAADFNQQGRVYAVIVGATVGVGRVTGIESAQVEGMPGVVAVITHRNAPRLPYGPYKSYIDPAVGERLHVLQDDRVRFYGQPVAIVVTDTFDRAERAAAALHVAYEAERPIVDPSDPKVEAIVPKAHHNEADKGRGDADGALASAPVKVDETYDIARENHNPMEPHATVAAISPAASCCRTSSTAIFRACSWPGSATIWLN
jgi:xanthine dehydrogenase YagR molybdenum-binding subunit